MEEYIKIINSFGNVYNIDKLTDEIDRLGLDINIEGILEFNGTSKEFISILSLYQKELIEIITKDVESNELIFKDHENFIRKDFGFDSIDFDKIIKSMIDSTIKLNLFEKTPKL